MNADENLHIGAHQSAVMEVFYRIFHVFSEYGAGLEHCVYYYTFNHFQKVKKELAAVAKQFVRSFHRSITGNRETTIFTGT